MKTSLTLFLMILCFIFYGQDQLGNPIVISDAATNFGQDVAISADGNFLITAANQVFDTNQTGFARVYNLQNNNWIQVGADLVGNANGDTFGESVAMTPDGSIVAVGAAQVFDGNYSGPGYVKVFEFSSGQYVQIGNDIIGETIGDTFGDAVALSNDGTRLIVGARFNDSFTGASSASNGHIRMYEFDGANWNQIGNEIDGTNPNDNFGNDVDMSGDGSRIISCSPGFDGPGVNLGRARIYEYNGSNWTQVGQDILGVNNSDFLSSVNMNDSGGRIAFKVGENAAVYEFDGSQWNILGNPIPGLNNEVDAVGINNSGNLVAIGSRFENSNTGYAQLFQFDGTDWVQVGNTLVGNGTDNYFGALLDLKNDKLAVASTDFNINTPNPGGVSAYDFNNLLSVSSESLELFSVFPNPSSDVLNVRGSRINKLELYDMLGRRIKNSTTHQILVSDVNPGVYILKISSDSNKITTKRVIIK